jgi:hypothetical protein
MLHTLVGRITVNADVILKGKVVPGLNEASRHEELWQSGGGAPRFLNVGTGRRSVVRFTPRALYAGARAHRCHWLGRWGGPHGRSRRRSEGLCLGPGRPVRSLATVLTGTE